MSSYYRQWFFSAYVCAVLALTLGGLSRVNAEDLKRTTSLKFAPAEVSFYSTVLRNREQFEIFLGSNTYTKLRNLPLLNFGLSMLQGQWESPTNDELRAFKEQWERPENQQLIKVLLDAVSQEVFVYGDDRFADVFKVAQEFQRAIRAAQVRAARDGESDPETEQKLIDEVVQRLEQIKTPGFMIGFRLTDADAAKGQIDRLETVLGEAFSQHEELGPLKERLKRETIGDGSFLVLPLDGSLVPWDAIPEESREKLPEKAREAISKLKLTISLGVKDGYLLLAFGESTKLLKQMGQGKLLIDRPELAALRQHADRRIVNVGYASGRFLEQANTAGGQIDDLVMTIETMLPSAELDEETQTAILADVKALAAEVKSFIPKPGAVAGFSFLTDRGFEGFEYKWGEDPLIDSSQKLTILDHLGGDPVAFTAGRSKPNAGGYDWIAKWVSKAYQHAGKIAAQKASDEERQHFEQVRERVLPLAKRFDKATRDDLIPALNDGQGAVVLDTKARSKQWHRDLPSTRVELPMFELAIVGGVSDRDALKRAGAEYFAILQAALDIAHELSNEEVPKINLPPPMVDSTELGDIYSYVIPGEAGLDSQVAPNVGLSKDFFVISMFPAQTKRLLQSSASKQLSSLAKADRPLAGASYCNVPKLIDAITPWVNFAVRIAGQAEGEENAQAKMAAQMVAGNVIPILDLLKCFGERASVTYVEGEAIVTHSVSVLVD